MPLSEPLQLLTWAVAVLFVIAGFVSMIVPVLPGPLLLFAGLFLGTWADNFAHVGTPTVILLLLLCALAMALDFMAGAMGAKRYGASKAAVTGALLGAMFGTFVFGPFGLVLGPFAGAMAGELLTGHPLEQAGKSGWGATLGMLVGVVAKLALGTIMVGVFTLAWLA